MTKKTNKLREENPVQLLMDRAAESKGIVLPPPAAQKVAATLIMESKKVQTLAGISQEQAEEIVRLEEFADIILQSCPEKKRVQVEAAARDFVWPAAKEEEEEEEEDA